MLEMGCARCIGIRVFIKEMMIISLMRVLGYLSKMNLSSPYSQMIMKSIKFICELRLKPIKPVLDIALAFEASV